MIDKELSKLKNDIPNIDIKDFKSGVYKKHNSRKKRNKVVGFKSLIVCISLIIITALIIVLIPTSKPINERIGGFYIKNHNSSLEESLSMIIDDIDFVYYNKSSSIEEFRNIGIISDNEYERINKLEENTTLNKGYELLENIDNNFRYACYIGKSKGKDIIILIDNNSSDDVVIYHYIDYKLNRSVDELLSVYKKYNNESDDVIDFTSDIESKNNDSGLNRIKYSFGDASLNRSVNVIVNNDKVETIYVNASSSNIEYINSYCDGYNENSLCYINDLKFEGAEQEPPKIYCYYFNTVMPLSSRIEGIKNQNKTIYEVKKSVENSPLLAAYVNKETYDLITKVYRNTYLVRGGKYPTSIAIYKSLIENGYIEDNIVWYEIEYDTCIPKTLDEMYYLDIFTYQEITVIKDVINNENINYTFKILIETFGVDYINNSVKVSLPKELSKTSLIYGNKMNVNDFENNNIEIIIKNVTGNIGIEKIIYENDEKFVSFFSSYFIIDPNATFEKAYEGYKFEIESILYKIEEVRLFKPEEIEPIDIVLEDGTIITLTPSYKEILDILGYNYFFKYDDYINYLRNKVE